MDWSRSRFVLLASLALALPLSAAAQSAFDGTYSGQRTVTADKTHAMGSCQPGQTKIVVQGGQFTWHPGGMADLTLKVAADGTFRTMAGDFQLSGRIVGNHFTADSTGAVCNFHFDATK